MLTNAWLAGLKAAAPPPAPGGVTWGDHSPAVTLSGADLVASVPLGGGPGNARTSTSKTTGKFHIEWRISSDEFYVLVGLFDATTDVTQDGQPPGSLMWLSNSTTASNSTDIKVAPGGWVAAEVNLDTGKLWFIDEDNAIVGGGNPAAGTSPTFTFTPNTELWAGFDAYGADAAASVITINGNGSFVRTVSTGFLAWGS